MDTPQESQTGKRPYESPAITSEAVFETTALACNKKMGESAKCNVSPKNS
jgi:hypothetical protein